MWGNGREHAQDKRYHKYHYSCTAKNKDRSPGEYVQSRSQTQKHVFHLTWGVQRARGMWKGWAMWACWQRLHRRRQVHQFPCREPLLLTAPTTEHHSCGGNTFTIRCKRLDTYTEKDTHIHTCQYMCVYILYIYIYINKYIYTHIYINIYTRYILSIPMQIKKTIAIQLLYRPAQAQGKFHFIIYDLCFILSFILNWKPCSLAVNLT